MENSPFLPTSLFKMTLTHFNVPYSYECRKYFNHVHIFFTLFTLPPHSSYFLSLNMRCFRFLSFTVLVFVHYSVGFFSWYFTCKYVLLQSVKSSVLLFLIFCLPPSTVVSMFCSFLFLHRYDLFQYYSLPIILFFFPSFLSLL
jgi:hypothetical protein